MKKLKRLFCLILAITTVFALTGCGQVININLSSADRPVITKTMYFTAAELKGDYSALQRAIMLNQYNEGSITLDGLLAEYNEGDYDTKIDPDKVTAKELIDIMIPDSGATLKSQLLQAYPGHKLVKTKKDGVKYYKLEQKFAKSENSNDWYVDLTTEEETYMSPTYIIASDAKKAELFLFDSYTTDSGYMRAEFSSYGEFYDLTAKLPFKVYYTNGVKTAKKSVSFDKSFAAGEERCVAVASKKIYDITDISAKIETVEDDFETGGLKILSSADVKNGKTYKLGNRLSVSSKNAIKVFTINGENIVENTFRFSDPGKYKVKIVLANDTSKEFTINIK